ncbi:hypothetical protein AJ79_03642 [Helicocarpus griseus UAMH5409]|uniref:Mediator of RNA polymerase II transcription subunit 4 n=1 Tax=Helicocarpus griseus UAMH5409 TaxID=1447875 RepID=A0A2B7XXL0_9EURO|nr:hypothetical protein AJ79_03642 [Helicocarpus griseus UAMH5409]
MDTQLLTPLTSLETRLNNLLMSIISSPTAAGAPAAALALLEADDALSSALDTLHTHQANYVKILRLRAEALSLEERVRDIVREVESVGNEIDAACQRETGASEDSESSEEDSEGEEDTQMGGVGDGSSGRGKGSRRNEVDYKLLVNFARRISRYNSEAAADAGAGSPTKTPPGEEQSQLQQKGVNEGGANGEAVERAGSGVGANGQQAKGVGVAALSQETVSWLNETANWSRDISRMPFPSEERIRMGVMGQLLAASSEGLDVEKEIERMIHASQGGGGAGVPASENVTGMDEVVGVGEDMSASGRGHDHVGGGGVGRADVGVPAGRPKPKPVLDLDLYDPDEDE